MKNNSDIKRIAITENIIAAGCAHTLGLKSDDNAVVVGNNDYNQCDV